MRFSTIGTSWITQTFQAAAQQAGWVYTCAYSRDAARSAAFAAQNGAASSCSDFSALLRGDCDVIYIASPNSLHFSQTMQCLRAGFHVVCEKPMFERPAEYEAAYQLAREQGVYLFEAFRHINSGGFSAVRDHLPKIAPIRNVMLSYNQYSTKYDAFLAGGETPNVFNPAYGGGALMDLGVYPLSFAAALWGMPQRAYACSIPLRNGIDGTGTLLLVYDGFLCNITFSKTASGFAENEIMGENGTIICGRTSKLNPITVRTGRNGDPKLLYEAPPTPPHLDQVLVFDRIIRERDDAAYASLCNVSRITARIIAEAVRL